MPLQALVQLALDHGFAAAANNKGVDVSIETHDTATQAHGVEIVHCANLKELMWAMGY